MNKKIKILICLTSMIMIYFALNNVAFGASFLDSDFELKTTDTGLFVSNAIYTLSDGSPLVALQAGQSIESKVTIKREIADQQTVTIVCALMNDKNTIEKMSYVTDTISNAEEKTLTAKLILPIELNSGYNLKTFVWDSLQGQWSYSEASRFPKTKIINSAWSMSDQYATYSSAEKHSRYSSLLLSPGSTGEAKQTVSVDPRNYYSVGFYVKGKSSFTYSILGVDNTVVLSKTFSGSDDWTHVSMAFDTGVNTEITLKLTNNTGNANIYIDDVSISKNHIINSGFEDQVTLPWQLGSDGTIDSAAPLLDTRSLKLSGVNLDEAYQMVNVVTDGDYVLSFQAKTATANTVVCRVYPDAGSSQYTEVPLSGTVGTSAKTTFNFIPTSDTVKISFVTINASGGATYIDNVNLSMFPSNLIINPGFEADGTISTTVNDYSKGWTARSSGVMVRVTDPQYVRSGSYAARLYNRGDNWSAMATDVLSVLKKKGAGNYYFECYVKTGNGITGTLTAKLDIRYTGGTKTLFQGSAVCKDSAWTKITFNANITSPPSLDIATTAWIYIEGSENDANKKFDYYADDFLFEKM